MQQSKVHVHTTENRCTEIFTAETFLPMRFCFSLFSRWRLSAIPSINMWGEGASGEEWDPMVLILMLFFSFLLFIHLLSTIRSSLSSNSPQHKGMNVLMRSNMSYIGSELLIYFCMAATVTFPKRMGLYKFPPDVCFATSLDVFLVCLSRMNAGLLACWMIFWMLIRIFFLNIYIRGI